jgi:pyruvate dehydrogenase kinase 2/3/4
MRAVAITHSGASSLPPIRATIVAGENDVGIRISDQGIKRFLWLVSVQYLNSLGGGLLTPQIQTPSDLFSFSHIRNSTRMENARIGALRTASLSQLGVKATVDEQVRTWRQQYKNQPKPVAVRDPEQEAGISAHQRIGIGLPMSNIFATWAFML